MNIREILIMHSKKYPLMEETDAVKLIFQNEFGGGHLISNENESLLYLEKEYESTLHNENVPLLEEIGNGIVRVNLAKINTEKMSIKELNRLFVNSSKLIRGNLESFEEKLEVLRELTKEGFFHFSEEDLSFYLENYKILGYKAVSHSRMYREEYHPAYRIVLKELLTK